MTLAGDNKQNISVVDFRLVLLRCSVARDRPVVLLNDVASVVGSDSGWFWRARTSVA